MLIQRFTITGMSCGACAFTIEKHFKRIKGIKDVTVDYHKKELKVRYDERAIHEKELIDSVAILGYGLQELKTI